MNKSLREDIMGAVARGWCSEKNSSKEMDTDLAFAITDELCKVFHDGDDTEEQTIPSDQCRNCGGLGYTVSEAGQDTHEQVQCPTCGGMGAIRPSFSQELEELLNRHSIENGSDTADFVLARYLMVCLRAFEQATNERDRLAGRDTGRVDKSSNVG